MTAISGKCTWWFYCQGVEELHGDHSLLLTPPPKMEPHPAGSVWFAMGFSAHLPPAGAFTAAHSHSQSSKPEWMRPAGLCPRVCPGVAFTTEGCPNEKVSREGSRSSLQGAGERFFFPSTECHHWASQPLLCPERRPGALEMYLGDVPQWIPTNLRLGQWPPNFFGWCLPTRTTVPYAA